MVVGRKAFVLSEEEHYWHGFIVDLDVQDALPLFKQAHITACKKDPQTVHEGWREYRTIVTNNEKDFLRYIPEHSKRDSGGLCQDCWGLLIVPGDRITRERVIPKIKNGIKIGSESIPWRAIGYANLCVSLHADGTYSVRRFQRCVRCERFAPIEAQWYKELPVIRRKKGRKND